MQHHGTLNFTFSPPHTIYPHINFMQHFFLAVFHPQTPPSRIINRSFIVIFERENARSEKEIDKFASTYNDALGFAS
jgi:hypothetical protein